MFKKLSFFEHPFSVFLLGITELLQDMHYYPILLKNKLNLNHKKNKR